MASQKKHLFIAACTGMLLFGVTMTSLGSILPGIISRYHIDEIAAGILASLLPLGILAGSFVFGPVIDNYGYKYLFIICTLLIVMALEGVAFSTDFFLLRLCFFAVGFGGGIINGSTNALVNDISTEGRSANLSLLGVFFGIGALGIPVLIGIFSNVIPDNTIIAFIGFLMMIPVIYFLLIRFPEPKITRKYPLKESLRMVKDPVLVLMGFFLFFEGGAEGIANTWTTTYLQEFIREGKKEAMFGLSCFVLSLTLTRLFLGYLLRKIPSYMVQFISICIASAGVIILMLSLTYSLTILGLVLLGVGCAAGFPVILGYVGELYKKLSGTAFSFVLVISLVGNILINYTMGLVFHYAGMKHFSSLLLICLVILMILFYLVIRKIRPRVDIKTV